MLSPVSAHYHDAQLSSSYNTRKTILIILVYSTSSSYDADSTAI